MWPRCVADTRAGNYHKDALTLLFLGNHNNREDNAVYVLENIAFMIKLIYVTIHNSLSGTSIYARF